MPASDSHSPVAFPPIDPDLVVLSGATASGKTALAIEVAKRINAEIISVDSIAVYKGMDIGTAKPSAVQRDEVLHHLIDIASPAETFSVANFLDAAWRAIRDIRARGKTPLLVGGTPMYLKGLLHGFDPGPPADWNFRQAVEQDLACHGPESLHRRLWQVDPLSAHRIAPSDVRRITRALEVAYLTGRPLSHQQTHFDDAPANDGNRFAIFWPREVLHRRIAERVEAMFMSGLVEEVKHLLEKHRVLSRTASIAVGYREVIAYLEGAIDYQTTIDQVVAHTRQMARRQETWLRSLAGIQPLFVDNEAEYRQLSSRVVSRLSEKHIR